MSWVCDYGKFETYLRFGLFFGQLKLSFLYPGTTGRNFDEVIRVLDSLQLAARHRIATPANWQKGEAVVISPSVSDSDAKKQFPQGWETVNLPSGKPYLRLTFADWLNITIVPWGIRIYMSLRNWCRTSDTIELCCLQLKCRDSFNTCEIFVRYMTKFWLCKQVSKSFGLFMVSSAFIRLLVGA